MKVQTVAVFDVSPGGKPSDCANETSVSFPEVAVLVVAGEHAAASPGNPHRKGSTITFKFHKHARQSGTHRRFHQPTSPELENPARHPLTLNLHLDQILYDQFAAAFLQAFIREHLPALKP